MNPNNTQGTQENDPFLQQAFNASLVTYQQDEDNRFDQHNREVVGDPNSLPLNPEADTLTFLHLMLRNRCVPLPFVQNYFYKAENSHTKSAVLNILNEITSNLLMGMKYDLSVIDDPVGMWKFNSYVVLSSSLSEVAPSDCTFADSMASDLKGLEIIYYRNLYQIFISPDNFGGIEYDELLCSTNRICGEDTIDHAEANLVLKKLISVNWLIEYEDHGVRKVSFGPRFFKQYEDLITSNAPLCSFCLGGVIGRSKALCTNERCKSYFHTSCFLKYCEHCKLDPSKVPCTNCKSGKVFVF